MPLPQFSNGGDGRCCGSQQLEVLDFLLGQFLPKSDVGVVSAYRPITDVRRSAANGRNGPKGNIRIAGVHDLIQSLRQQVRAEAAEFLGPAPWRS